MAMFLFIAATLSSNRVSDSQIWGYIRNTCKANEAYWRWWFYYLSLRITIQVSVGGTDRRYACAFLVMSGIFATPRTVPCQSPLSMGFSRQESWSGLPFPPPGDLPNSGIEPITCHLHCRQILYHWPTREALERRYSEGKNLKSNEWLHSFWRSKSAEWNI